jgi:hypothetical protein
MILKRLFKYKKRYEEERELNEALQMELEALQNKLRSTMIQREEDRLSFDYAMHQNRLQSQQYKVLIPDSEVQYLFLSRKLSSLQLQIQNEVWPRLMDIAKRHEDSCGICLPNLWESTQLAKPATSFEDLSMHKKKLLFIGKMISLCLKVVGDLELSKSWLDWVRLCNKNAVSKAEIFELVKKQASLSCSEVIFTFILKLIAPSFYFSTEDVGTQQEGQSS